MAGLVELLLGKDNPVTQWTGRNSNLLTGLGTSLLSDGMNFAPAQAGSVLDRQAAQQKDADAKLAASTNATKQWLAQNYPDLAQAVDAGLPVSEAWQEAFNRKNQKVAGNEYQDRYNAGGQYGLTGEALNTFALTGALPGTNKQNVTYGTTPVWGTDASGKPGYGVTGSDGSFKLVDTNGFQPVDPVTMTGNKAGVTVDAKTAAAARGALRAAEISNSNTAKAIGDVRAQAKGMNEWFGQIGPRGVYINPGSEMGKFWAAAEPTNNQAFMQAREALKGGGQITDYEGRKAEDAFSRMRAALEKGDQAQYLQALTDFEDAVALGYQKLKEAAGGGYSAPALGVPQGVPGNTTSTGVTWSVSP